MNKGLFFSVCIAMVLVGSLRGQEAGKTYYIVSNLCNLKISAVSPASGANVQQAADNSTNSQWTLMDAGSGRFNLMHVPTGLYLAAPASGTNTAGKKLELTGVEDLKAKWIFESQAGALRIKNAANNLFMANLGKTNPGTSINQVLSPGGGALWKLEEISQGGNNTNISGPTGPVTSIKDYPVQTLTNSRNVGASQSISQNISMNYGYDVKAVYGKPASGNGQNRKFIVLETHGTQGFNPGSVVEDGTRNDKAKFRGYYIESIKTEARVVSGNATVFASLPPNDAQTGSTGVSQGFSISLSGGGGFQGGTSGGGNVGVQLEIGYDFSKSSSLNWTDFKITENQNSTSAPHTYKLSSIRTQAGGVKPYDDYKDLKNPNNLGIKPLHILPSKAVNNFPLYEWIAFEAPESENGQVTIEIKAEMVVNYVKWTGSQIVQYPETLTNTKQFTINLSDVGPANP